jgi:hypothetical protein
VSAPLDILDPRILRLLALMVRTEDGMNRRLIVQTLVAVACSGDSETTQAALHFINEESKSK